MQFPDLAAGVGQPLLILGESGTGKTTLLHLLAGILKAREGQVFIENTDLEQLSGRQLDRFRGENIGLIFQQPHFVEALSVADNLALANYLPGRDVDRARIRELLATLGLEDKADRKPRQLSVGEQQRVAIARALMNRPRLLLADEPTSALDDRNCEAVVQLLQQAAADAQSALVIVTHDNRLKSAFDQHLILSAA